MHVAEVLGGLPLFTLSCLTGGRGLWAWVGNRGKICGSSFASPHRWFSHAGASRVKVRASPPRGSGSAALQFIESWLSALGNRGSDVDRGPEIFPHPSLGQAPYPGPDISDQDKAPALRTGCGNISNPSYPHHCSHVPQNRESQKNSLILQRIWLEPTRGETSLTESQCRGSLNPHDAGPPASPAQPSAHSPARPVPPVAETKASVKVELAGPQILLTVPAPSPEAPRPPQ